ncbi:NAD-dependent epimerase/dehydratase family protein [Chitinophaga pinensis]|uniref:NAD-dependent epimerase/dehydratase n=1 Tax=Chitinophaga pinensis (strain ATCC 43595 / DSM 2588 / LMG 13176 / NBRC 15968 / NCIMB 11800 / UQM 2034) TaxID=485918 RepID=A0A979G7Q5_CHIPD|nr:NAD-dependent epimerase/dehydratase family protein [Chitinophaga pinensis]ACU62183.1 NAD-dependent epimerase/dehydratase [Chitinophaga pinensis DSM 2588]
MKASLLLTGASGFLGTEILHTLRSEYEVTTIGRNGPEYGQTSHMKMDLSREKTRELPACEVVVHCAGKAHVVPASPEEADEFYKVNLYGTVHLCESLEASDAIPVYFVFISTVAVYGVDEGVLINEQHPLNGDTPYARSKIQAEHYLTEWCGQRDVQLLILRLPLIAGPEPPGNLGAMIRGIASGRYLSIGDAAARKSVVWAGDVAAVIPVAMKEGGVYNLTDGYHPSFRELETCIATALKKKVPSAIPMGMAKMIAGVGNLLGKRAPVNSDKLRKITSTLTFDDGKARRAFNWQPSRVIDKLSSVL